MTTTPEIFFVVTLINRESNKTLLTTSLCSHDDIFVGSLLTLSVTVPAGNKHVVNRCRRIPNIWDKKVSLSSMYTKI